VDFSLQDFHFIQQEWLAGLVIIPLVWLLHVLLYKYRNSSGRIELFADKHLLPHLIKNQKKTMVKKWPSMALWSIVWTAGILAMAGPRWDYIDIDLYEPDASLVILLDLSASMNVTDIKPSRIARARQEIEDLLKISKGIKIGLVAFAATPHMISPVTDDVDTILNLLPSLDTSLVFIQGSRIAPALEMGTRLLNSEPGKNKAMLIMSDGGFQEENLRELVKSLVDPKTAIHTMGFGTKIGAPIPDNKGNWKKYKGKTVISNLESGKLIRLSRAGKGLYTEANYLDNDTLAIITHFEKVSAIEQKTNRKHRHWKERFYILVSLMLLPVLIWFKKGYAFPVIILLAALPVNSHALELDKNALFKNQQQQANEAFNKGDYETAIEKFEDPYRKGVSQYRAGKYEEAQQSFSISSRKNVAADTKYNIGNALFMQNKLKQAVETYEELLENHPDHQDAKFNLDLARKMLKQQKKQQKKSDKDKQQDKKDQQQQQNKDQKNQDKEDKKDSKKDDKQKNERQKNQDKKKNDSSNKNKNQKKDEQKQDKKPSDEEKKPQSKFRKNEQELKQQKAKSEMDISADQWLNRIESDPKKLLNNQFFIEEKQDRTTTGSIKPW